MTTTTNVCNVPTDANNVPANDQGGLDAVTSPDSGRVTIISEGSRESIALTARTFQEFLREKSQEKFKDADLIRYRQFRFSQITEESFAKNVIKFIYSFIDSLNLHEVGLVNYFAKTEQSDEIEMEFYRQYLNVQKCYEKFSGKATNESYKELKAAFEKLHKDFNSSGKKNKAILINVVLNYQLGGGIAEKLLDYCAEKALTKKNDKGVEDFGANFKAFFDPKKQMKQFEKKGEGYTLEQKTIATVFNATYSRVLQQSKGSRLSQSAQAMNNNFSRMPSDEEIRSYEQHIQERLKKVIESGEPDKSIDDICDLKTQRRLIAKCKRYRSLIREREKIVKEITSLSEQLEKERAFFGKSKNWSYEVLNEVFGDDIDNLPEGFEKYAELHKAIEEKKRTITELEETIRKDGEQVETDYYLNKGYKKILNDFEELKETKEEREFEVMKNKARVFSLELYYPKITVSLEKNDLLYVDQLRAQIVEQHKIKDAKKILEINQAKLDLVTKQFDQAAKDLAEIEKSIAKAIEKKTRKNRGQKGDLESDIAKAEVEITHVAMAGAKKNLEQKDFLGNGAVFILYGLAQSCSRGLEEMHKIEQELEKNRSRLDRNSKLTERLRTDFAKLGIVETEKRDEDSEDNKQIDGFISGIVSQVENGSMRRVEGAVATGTLTARYATVKEVTVILNPERVRQSLQIRRKKIVDPLRHIAGQAASSAQRNIAQIMARSQKRVNADDKESE